MPATIYTAWSVTAGEQPTTAYWNILGSNDGSFNTGNGFNDAIIIARHIAAGAVTSSAFGANSIFSTALGLSALLDPTNGVKTLANSGTAGGTMWYINLGGIKILWGETNSQSSGNPGISYGINWPTSFFTTVQTVVVTGQPATTPVNQTVAVNSFNNSGAAFYFSTTSASSQFANYIAIGT